MSVPVAIFASKKDTQNYYHEINKQNPNFSVHIFLNPNLCLGTAGVPQDKHYDQRSGNY